MNKFIYTISYAIAIAYTLGAILFLASNFENLSKVR